MVDQLPKENTDGAAYTISKKFVIWFTQRKAMDVGARGGQIQGQASGKSQDRNRHFFARA